MNTNDPTIAQEMFRERIEPYIPNSVLQRVRNQRDAMFCLLTDEQRTKLKTWKPLFVTMERARIEAEIERLKSTVNSLAYKLERANLERTKAEIERDLLREALRKAAP